MAMGRVGQVFNEFLVVALESPATCLAMFAGVVVVIIVILSEVLGLGTVREPCPTGWVEVYDTRRNAYCVPATPVPTRKRGD